MRPSAGRPSLRRPSSQRPPCFEHGLATGPDGLCALCKRSSRPAPAEPPASPIGRFVTAVLGMLTLACAGLAFAGALGWVELDGLVPASLRPPPVAELKRELAAPERGLSQPSAEKTPAQRAAEQLARQIAEQQRKLAEVSAAPPDELEGRLQEMTAAQERAEQERRDRERHERIEADIEARALKRAREKVSITMYSTSWCPVCTAARTYMTDNAIAFTEHDIEQSPSARTIQRRLNPKGSIPTIDVEGQVLVGFSGESLDKLIESAAKKRLR